MGANNTSQFFDNLTQPLGKSFNHKDLNRVDDCSMSDKAILYAVDELNAGEVPEFTAHLHDCRFCMDLILDLRMADQESRESSGQSVEVIPALAEAVLHSSYINPEPRLTAKTGEMLARLRSCLSLPKLLVPLATACLIFILVQSGFKDPDSVVQHEVLRNRVEAPKPDTVPPARSTSMSPDNSMSPKSVSPEKHDPSNPRETLYSMTPASKARPEPPVVAKKRKKRIPLSPLERFDLDQLKLVGIVHSPGGYRAIVEDHSGKGHILKVGTYIGRNNGRVIRIEKDRVVIAEEITAESGNVTVKENVLKLHS